MTRTCAIATPHTLATASGEEAVRRGGNAIDAALAAAATLTVVYPHNTALGGDLIALIRSPDGRIACLNASGPAPCDASPTAIAGRHGGRMPVTGPDTITVPGLVAGWGALQEAGAELAWRDHFPAAIGHAAGTPVVPGLAAAIAESTLLIAADPGMAAVFSPGGAPLTAGDILRQDALGVTLGLLAESGPAALYGGPVGAALVAGLRGLGSPMGIGDLADYRVERCAPLSRAFGGYRVHTSPPNTQGVFLLQALTGVDGSLELLGVEAGRLAAIFHQGILDRDRYLADPRFVPVDVDGLLSSDRPQSDAGAAGTGRASGDTVAVVAADSDGYAVSLIQSLFHGFGAGILEPATGIVMHNRGSFFSLDPGSPNVLAPGKRPAHTLMPVMVTDGDRLAWVNGVMGGKAQPQIHTQLLLRLLAGATPAEAVSAPRWVVGSMEVGGREDTVRIEADVDPGARASLAAAGAPLVDLPARSEEVGHAQVIAVHRDGSLHPGSDPRADGAAAITSR